jgi:filamentous hemagglutinin family protein
MKNANFASRGLQVNLLAAAVAACFSSGGAIANPTGGVPQGASAVTFANLPGNVLQVTNSPNSIIHWQSFSIGTTDTTRFVQQSATSAVLNRVVAPNPSEILGTLQSNGRVFLINPSGILFGGGSIVDVAGMVASSLNLTDTNFLAGKLIFDPVPGAGSVTNQGYISTATGGHVLLVGPAVSNGGVINTPQGTWCSRPGTR